MNDRLPALRLFVRVARTGSFSSAGREMGLSQPSASRLIAMLEEEVGTTLFTRTTRAVSLTEAGAQYLSRIEPILFALDEADHEARGDGELRGTIRLGLSSSFGTREIIPRLPKFTQLHPHLKIDLAMDDQYLDLAAAGIDVALRFGPLTDSNAVARRIAHWPKIAVASPAYLARQGTPKSPAELANHFVITRPAGNQAWEFTKEDRIVSARVNGKMHVNSNEGLIAACLAGFGIVTTTTGSVRAEIDSGQLVRVLGDWEMGIVIVHALLMRGKHSKPAARAIVEWLAQEFVEIEVGTGAPTPFRKSAIRTMFDQAPAFAVAEGPSPHPGRSLQPGGPSLKGLDAGGS